MTTKEKLNAAGWETRANKYAGKCISCRGWIDAGAGRIARNLSGTRQWLLAHRNHGCTDGLIGVRGGSVGDSVEIDGQHGDSRYY